MAELQLASPYNQVTKRDGTNVTVGNFRQRIPAGFESFTSGTVTFTLADYEAIKFEGDHVIDDVTRAYPQLAIRDFELRPFSGFTLGGDRFTLGPSPMMMGLTMANGNQTISVDAANPTEIVVQTTNNFLDSGHLFTSARSLIEYTSKVSSTRFLGYVKSGPNTLNNNDELIQFSGPE
jgi:hypothetical protein